MKKIQNEVDAEGNTKKDYRRWTAIVKKAYKSAQVNEWEKELRTILLGASGIDDERYIRLISALISHLLSEQEERIVGDLSEWIRHDSQCICSQWSAGRPTEDGGYESKFAGKWYQKRPIDKTPKCDCGLNDVLSALRKKGGEKI